MTSRVPREEQHRRDVRRESCQGVQGTFLIVAVGDECVYAARGWKRRTLSGLEAQLGRAVGTSNGNRMG